jgi:thermostable 8-oxoguanine DNA glycosylase
MLLFQSSQLLAITELVDSKFLTTTSPEKQFYELCFAMCSPQVKWDANQLANSRLKAMRFYEDGCSVPDINAAISNLRFHEAKAINLQLMREDWVEVRRILGLYLDGAGLRAQLVYKLRGLGMKTASHFLRNIGLGSHLAIIDTHICKFMECDPPRSTRAYLKLEEEFNQQAYTRHLLPIHLDCYLWAYYSGHTLEEVR